MSLKNDGDCTRTTPKGDSGTGGTDASDKQLSRALMQTHTDENLKTISYLSRRIPPVE